MNLSDITEKPLIIAVMLARESYNASIPAEVQDGVDGDDKPVMVPNPALFATDEEYFDARILNMVESWAKQHGTDLTEIDGKITELQTKRAEIVAKDSK